MTGTKTARRTSPLARRMILLTIAFSSAVTLVVTCFQLYRDYSRDITSINDNLAQIRDVHLDSISETLWSTGRSRLKIQLDGMLRMRDMHYLAVRDGDMMWAEAGRLTSNDVIRVDLPIFHEHRGAKIQIGTLTAVASLEDVYSRIYNEAFIILASNALKTFLVAGFMLMMIRALVTRHLEHIADHVRTIDVTTDAPALKLDRKKSIGDELDTTVDAIANLQAAVRDALERYRASEANYRGLFENASDAIFVIDPKDGSIIDCNRNAEITYGYSRKEFLHMTIHDLGTVEDRTRADSRLRLIDSRGSMVFERKHRMRTGELRQVEINSTVIEAGGKRVIMSIVRDMTERERSIHALRQSEEQFRSVVTAMAEGVIILDAQGKILSCNASAERILGFSASDVVGTYAHEQKATLMGEDGSAFPAPELPSAYTLRTGLPKRDVVVGMVRADQKLVWVSANSQPIPGSRAGSVASVVVSFTDITARKEAEVERARLQAQLQQSQKMEAVGQMAGGIAHDFNNILGSIIGYASLGLERYVDDPQGRVANCLREVLTAGERARDLIAKLLAFSRARPVSPRTIDPGGIVREVSDMLMSTIPSSITLRSEIEPDIARVRIDPVHLQQVVMNLCVNARDSIEMRGEVSIKVLHSWRTHAICASCQGEVNGDFVEISVRDTGSGIPAEQHARVFEPFFTTKGPGKGTGMGLSVVHGIVHDYAGHIVLDSAPGEGTTIKIYLPAVYDSADKDVSKDGPLLRAAGIESGRHVLVVDDEDVLSRLMAEVLRAHGYRATSFSDAPSALAAFMHSPEKYDAVITDQTMPGLTGGELAGQVLKVRPDLPVILCTGYSDQIDEKAATAMGIRRFLMKPLKPPELILMLDEILATHH